MANINRNYVNITVDKKYFENCFEPERKKISGKLGINFSQRQFTEYLHNSKAQIKYPRTKVSYLPKRKRGRFSFTL